MKKAPPRLHVAILKSTGQVYRGYSGQVVAEPSEMRLIKAMRAIGVVRRSYRIGVYRLVGEWV